MFLLLLAKSEHIYTYPRSSVSFSLFHILYVFIANNSAWVAYLQNSNISRVVWVEIFGKLLVPILCHFLSPDSKSVVVLAFPFPIRRHVGKLTHLH